NFITSGEIHCPPTGERFLLDISQYYTPIDRVGRHHQVKEGIAEAEDDTIDDAVDDMLSTEEKIKSGKELHI
ncbi:unnamed protein product, partial [Schistosoma turkestanicum]